MLVLPSNRPFPYRRGLKVPKHNGTGVLIAFEGIDGAGKTTQAALLSSLLTAAGEPHISSKEPTNGSWGRRIRESAQTGRLGAQEELKFLIRDRQEHIEKVVQPALDDGKIVILDRYYYSTIAYQGARGYPIDGLQGMMEVRFLLPDAVFLLDVDPQISLPRVKSRGDVPNEFERLDALVKARSLFSQIRDASIVKIDGSLPIDTVQSEITKRFIDGPLKARRCAKDYGCDDPFSCIFRISNTCQWINSLNKFRSVLTAK
jgi:dTMP kinase